MKLNAVYVILPDRAPIDIDSLRHHEMKKCSRVQRAGAGWRARVQCNGELYVGSVRRSRVDAAIEADAISELLLGPSARKNFPSFQLPLQCALVDSNGETLVHAGQYGVRAALNQE